jgi:hypothetical protein
MTKMKAILLRVGIDKGCGGALSPIFEDSSFEYIPIPEFDPDTHETRTYQNTSGRKNMPLSYFLPPKICNDKMHFDPEFETFTYGDPSSKRKSLLKLNKRDLLIFYAGLTPYKNDKYPNALYIIGYFVVEKVVDFNELSGKDKLKFCNRYSNNAHIKQKDGLKNLVIVLGNKKKSKLLDKAILISEPKLNKVGRPYHAVSNEMEKLLGIKGSIQRSIPPRMIKDPECVENLNELLNIKDI